ncbi:MAG: 1-acyl-sn-glycerol-3-phosphate acyltransferase, partial [Mycobacterium sp.]
RFIERAVIDEVMYELMELSGQEYVDIYAAKLKQDVPGGSDAKPVGPPVPSARIPETAAG